MRKLGGEVYLCVLAIVVTSLTIPNRMVAAEAYPNKPIQIVVPFAAGGPTDLGIRTYGEQIGKILKTPVVVVNKPGAGGSLGTSFVVGAKNDGYTLLGGSSSPIVVMPITNPKSISYDSIRDLEPIAHCISLITIMVVRADSPFNSFEDLEKYVKANPGKLNIGVPGTSHPYYIYHLLKAEGLDMNLVVATGVPQNVSFLLGGHVDVAIDHPGINVPHIREGRMKGLVLFSQNRMSDIPNIPTIGEKGYPKAALIFWIGFLAPKGTPQPILDVLAAALKEASADPETVAKLNKLFFPIDFKPGSELKALIENQQKIIREIAVKTNLIQ